MIEMNRRTVLGGAAGVGAAVVLAACGSGDGSTMGKAPSDGSLGKAADVPVGGGTVFENGAQPVVVTQLAEGQYKAFSAVCTHAGCTVANVSSGAINCPCHGSKYSASDGSVLNGPATLPLKAKEITIKDGKIFLA